MIRDAIATDAVRIAEIYNYYINETVITFEESEVDADEMTRRMDATTSRGYPYLVIENAGRVVGYAYADQWRTRVAYRHSVESAIYLDCDQQGRGFGKALYQHLIDQLRQMGSVHVVVGGIALPNPGSVKLHQQLGFRNVGIHREVGRKFGRWIDVQFLELHLPIPSV